MSEPTKENQKMPFGWALFCILFLLISMILSVVWLDIPVHINLLASMAVTLAVAAITALVTAGRLSVWESDVSPVTQLLFVPGVPAAFALLGTLLGWRLWKRLWSPRVVKDRRGG